MSTITVNQRAFTEALMLAIVAPDEEKSKKARDLASLIGTSLSEKDKEYSKMGIEVCLEYLRKYP
jgi:rRNA maturation endonuclease Nob1